MDSRLLKILLTNNKNVFQNKINFSVYWNSDQPTFLKFITILYNKSKFKADSQLSGQKALKVGKSFVLIGLKKVKKDVNVKVCFVYVRFEI